MAKLFSDRPRNAPRPRRSAGHGQLTTYYRADANPSSSNSPFKPQPAKKSHRKLLLGIVDIALIIALVFVVGYSLIVNPSPNVIANSYAYHPAQSYASAASAQLGSLKNHNKISFNEQAVILALQKQFPEISGAQVELPFFSQKPTIRLNIAEPSFKLTSGGQTYIIDSQGIVVAKATDMPNVKNLPSVVDQSGFSANVGKRVLDYSAVGFINTVIAQCQKAKVPISQLTLPPLPQEMDLRTTDQPYYVRFYLGGDPMVQTGQFLALRNQFSKNHNAPSQYLDVRVDGKVFFK
ncbi:MAG TPA: hypothetical protein VFP32_00630 [Candidatus Saccharimonadales bacterium]|nr:hypothetical protein [Candidatus Saccharimonadales bacterium]